MDIGRVFSVLPVVFSFSQGHYLKKKKKNPENIVTFGTFRKPRLLCVILGLLDVFINLNKGSTAPFRWLLQGHCIWMSHHTATGK